MSVVWQDPPTERPIRATTSRWIEVAASLRLRVGQWALIASDFPASNVSGFRKGLNPDFQPAGAWEFRIANMQRPSGRCDVYARYVQAVSA